MPPMVIGAIVPNHFVPSQHGEVNLVLGGMDSGYSGRGVDNKGLAPVPVQLKLHHL